MNRINAKIIADSISPQGHRITSMLLTYPRIIHSEIMTHRMFSRNSASSRAIPFEKMVKMVEENPFTPIAWQKKHKGMQGTEYLNNNKINFSIEKWLQARDSAVHHAKQLNSDLCEVTKQLCNRLLEPFMWHTTLITATEFDNFFELRTPNYQLEERNDFDELIKIHTFKSKKDVLKEGNWYSSEVKKFTSNFTNLDWLEINHSQAEIHIQALAEAMWDAMNESTPKQLASGEWHIPFGDKFDKPFIKREETDSIIVHWIPDPNLDGDSATRWIQDNKVKVATARCAKLSYMNFDGEINYEKDIKLHDQLLKDKHYSSFEHCARAMSDEEYETNIRGEIDTGFDVADKTQGWSNNFKGFIQYRYLRENGYKNKI
jgi:thymidylate synthase ThyX